jgi:hypothetical protein
MVVLLNSVLRKRMRAFFHQRTKATPNCLSLPTTDPVAEMRSRTIEPVPRGPLARRPQSIDSTWPPQGTCFFRAHLKWIYGAGKSRGRNELNIELGHDQRMEWLAPAKRLAQSTVLLAGERDSNPRR